MKTSVTFTFTVPLLEQPTSIECYIVSENGIIIGHEVSKKQLIDFKNQFYNKFLLEYGDLKLDFINNTYNSYILKLNDFLNKEEKKEEARILKLLDKLDEETLDYLKIVKSIRENKNK